MGVDCRPISNFDIKVKKKKLKARLLASSSFKFKTQLCKFEVDLMSFFSPAM